MRRQLRPAGPGARPPPQHRHDRPRATTGGRSGSSCRSSTPGTTRLLAGRARSASWSTSYASGERPTPTGQPWSALTVAEQDALLDGAAPGVHLARRRSTGAPGWAPCWPTRRSPPTGAVERGNYPVFKRNLRQWMMRITAYADALVADLDRLDWPEPIKLMQRNWIGRSEGARVGFAVAAPTPMRSRCSPRGRTRCSVRPTWCWRRSIRLLDTRRAGGGPAGWPAASRGPAERRPRGGGRRLPYQRRAVRRARWSVRSRAARRPASSPASYAVNPVNGAQLPVFIADYVLMGYGTGAIMAVPAEDQRDWDFAEAFGLPVVRTVAAAGRLRRRRLHRRGPAINSGFLDGLSHAGDQGGASTDGWWSAARARRPHLQAARLAVQPAALLG